MKSKLKINKTNKLSSYNIKQIEQDSHSLAKSDNRTGQASTALTIAPIVDFSFLSGPRPRTDRFSYRLLLVLVVYRVWVLTTHPQSTQKHINLEPA